MRRAVNPDEERISHALLTAEEWRKVAHALRLSPREREIVQSIFDGRKELGIALDLGLSRHTVHTYLRRIFIKTGVADQRELIIAVFAAFLETSDRVD